MLPGVNKQVGPILMKTDKTHRVVLGIVSLGIASLMGKTSCKLIKLVTDPVSKYFKLIILI